MGEIAASLGTATGFIGLGIAYALKAGSVYDWGPPADVVTEQFVADVFGVEATVEHEGNGGPNVHPKRPLME